MFVQRIGSYLVHSTVLLSVASGLPLATQAVPPLPLVPADLAQAQPDENHHPDANPNGGTGAEKSTDGSRGVESIGTLSGSSVPERTLAEPLPPTSPETLDLIRFVIAEQEKTREALKRFDFKVRDLRLTNEVKDRYTLERTISVTRGKDSFLVVEELADTPMYHAPRSSSPYLRNSGVPMVSRSLRLPTVAVDWTNVLRPALTFRNREDWQQSKIDYDAEASKMIRPVDPSEVSFRTPAGCSLDRCAAEVLSRVSQYWRWEAIEEGAGLIRLSEYSRIAEDFRSVTFTVDMTKGGVVLGGTWSPKGEGGPRRVDSRTYVAQGDIYLPSEHITQEFDTNDALSAEIRLSFAQCSPSNMGQTLTLSDLDAPSEAIWYKIEPSLAGTKKYSVQSGRLISVE